MNRKYLSGAQKRKIKDDNKQKNDELLKKIPKINNFFDKPHCSTSQSQTEATDGQGESESDGIDITQTQSNEYAATSDSDSHDRNDKLDELSENVSDSVIETLLDSYEYPTDAALWNMDSDMHGLQSFWAKYGMGHS